MKYEITKEQILQLSKMNCVIEEHIKEWFPEAFTQLSSYFTGWAKSTVIDNEKWLMYFEKGILKYGFDANGDWFLPYSVSNIKKSDIEASESEVFEALKKEAVKRGFVEGTWISWKDEGIGQIKSEVYWASYSECIAVVCDTKTTTRHNQNFPLLKDGKWAEICETITKEQAEKLLNKKII